MPERKRILIVGGVAGGASAATRARRLDENAEIVIFERGEHVSFANCGLPYHIGGAIPERDRLLVHTPESLWGRYRLDVRTRHEVVAIDREAKTVTVRDLAADRELVERYDALILSPGAAPVRPPIPGIDSANVFTLRNLTDMDRIKQRVDHDSPKRAVVVGGGYIGLEMTEALCERGVAVTLVELADQVFAAVDPEIAAPIHEQLVLHGVDLRLKTSVDAIEPAGDASRVRLSTGETVDAGLVVLAIGVRPETTLAAEAGLAIGERGGIAADEHMRTSDPDIYAVGDAVEVTHAVSGQKALIPLAGPAGRQGRIAADAVFGRESAYRGTQGTAICKVFDLAVGMTGLSEKALDQAGMAYEKVYVHPFSHADYYPGAAQISLKVLFDPSDGRVLGAQAVGADGVDKRIDVLAVAIRARLTVADLEHLELSYAPPYGSAKDPVNYAGFVASSLLSGDARQCHAEEAARPTDDQLVLDVSTPDEVQAGTVPGAVNMPIDELRDRLGELPRDKELLVACRVGLRGYAACRVLEQNGFRCRNLAGGYKTFKAVTRPVPEAPAVLTKECVAVDRQEERQAAAGSTEANAVKIVDACGLQCPGPIMRLRQELDQMADGQALTIRASDPGFASDVAAWCQSTGHQLQEAAPENGHYRATVVKRAAPAAATSSEPLAGTPLSKKKSIVVFSGDLDKVLAGFVIANGAAAMGSEVTLFFTFWGLNALRKPEKVKVKKTLVERMFGWMMPRGARRLPLSKMNMGGMGKRMIEGIMRKKNVASLPEMIASARQAGVRLVACSMSMDLMGIKREELIDGVEEGGVALFLSTAEQGNVSLFI